MLTIQSKMGFSYGDFVISFLSASTLAKFTLPSASESQFRLAVVIYYIRVLVLEV